MKYTWELITFNDDDLEGTTQPHDDALVVMTRINSFIVNRVLVDQGSEVEVMYPNLFRGLSLKNEYLSKYDTPLVGFDGQMVVFSPCECGRQGSNGDLYSGQFIFPVYSYSQKTMDSCNGSNFVYIAC